MSRNIYWNSLESSKNRHSDKIESIFSDYFIPCSLISKKKTLFINFKIHFSIEKIFNWNSIIFKRIQNFWSSSLWALHPIKGPFHLRIVSSFFFIEMSLDSRSNDRSSFITFLTKILNYENDILVLIWRKKVWPTFRNQISDNFLHWIWLDYLVVKLLANFYC